MSFWWPILAYNFVLNHKIPKIAVKIVHPSPFSRKNYQNRSNEFGQKMEYQTKLKLGIRYDKKVDHTLQLRNFVLFTNQ